MKGFISETQLANLQVTKPLCHRCRLDMKCNSPRIGSFGHNAKNIMIIYSNVSEDQDKIGSLFDGGSYLSLVKPLSRIGVSVANDCLVISATDCRNEEHNTKAIDHCRPYVLGMIEEHKPHIIITVGLPALRSLVSNRISFSIGKTAQWRGFQIPDQKFKAWIVPLHSTAFMFGEKVNPAYKTIFNNDLAAIKPLLKKDVPNYGDEKDKITIVTEKEHIKGLLKGIKKTDKVIAFDYEGTGLKPYASGHRLVSASIAFDGGCISFPLYGEILPEFLAILSDPNIKKIAQNFKYENTWTLMMYQCVVKNWVWDTMVAAHLLDNREGVTGLKFQVYQKYGLPNYSGDVDAMLKSGDSNSINRIDEINIKDLLLYGGMDSMFTFRIAKEQTKIMGFYNDIFG